MITVGALGSKIAAYLQRTTDEFFVNEVDLLLDAINKTRQYAQMQHDFELANLIVDVSVSLSTGTLVSPAWLHGSVADDDLVTIKKILRAYTQDSNGAFRPINFVNRGNQRADEVRRYRGDGSSDFSTTGTYPSPINYYNTPTLTQNGVNLTLYPSNSAVFGSDPVIIVCDAVRYFPDLLADGSDNSDFLLQFADEFLFWGSVCRLNYLNKEFVQREEGNVGSPYKERDEAWLDLIAWDRSLVVSGDTSINLD